MRQIQNKNRRKSENEQEERGTDVEEVWAEESGSKTREEKGENERRGGGEDKFISLYYPFLFAYFSFYNKSSKVNGKTTCSTLPFKMTHRTVFRSDSPTMHMPWYMMHVTMSDMFSKRAILMVVMPDDVSATNEQSLFDSFYIQQTQ